jgi:hypothetical protein
MLVLAFSLPKSLRLKFLRVSPMVSNFYGEFCVESAGYGRKRGGGYRQSRMVEGGWYTERTAGSEGCMSGRPVLQLRAFRP